MTKAIKTWLNTFGWPVFMADDVPHDADLPYITVRVSEPEWSEKAQLQVQLWAYTKANDALFEKADAIVGSVGVGLRLNEGSTIVVVYPDTPAVQPFVEKNVRRALLLFQINSYHVPGV